MNGLVESPAREHAVAQAPDVAARPTTGCSSQQWAAYQEEPRARGLGNRVAPSGCRGEMSEGRSERVNNPGQMVQRSAFPLRQP